MAAGILALALAAPGSAPQAAETSALKFSGSFRIRQESLDGQYRPGFDAGSVLSTNDVNTFESVQTYVTHEFTAPFGRDLQLWGAMGARPGLLPGGALGEFTYVRLQEEDHGVRATRNRKLDSISLRAIRDPGAGQVDFELAGIIQSGDIRASTAANATTLDVNAWFLHADAGYTFSSAGKPRLSVEFDYASGDGPGAGYQRFDTLGSFAGQQLDGRVRYWIVPQKLRAEVNAVWLMRGDLLRNAPNAAPHGDTRYLAAAITLSY